MFDDKNLLITGGTGSFGKKFVDSVLNKYKPKLIVFSRDEMKQWEMAKLYPNHKNLRFFMGDVRVKIDYTEHSRTLITLSVYQNMPIADHNPFECVKTNVLGAMNVIDASIDQGKK